MKTENSFLGTEFASSLTQLETVGALYGAVSARTVGCAGSVTLRMGRENENIALLHSKVFYLVESGG
jgi:hypothetical protein